MKGHVLLSFTLIALCLRINVIYAQDSTVNLLKNTIKQINYNRENLLREQIYVQTDKPYYAINDTIWLKAYLLNSALLQSHKSGLIYIEFLNDSSKLVRRMMLPVKFGIGWGNIAIDRDNFTDGNYTLRCYTNWQRNFGVQAFYSKNISIGSSAENTWLVTSSVVKSEKGIHADLQLKLQDQRSVGLQDLKVKVYNGKHLIYNDKITTNIDGALSFNFEQPEKNLGGYVATIQNLKLGDAKILAIPLRFNKPLDVDLQFMPEGGNLIAGIKNNVAFKALGTEGLSADVEGVVTDSKFKEVARFKSMHNGISIFEFKPLPGEFYTANIVLANGARRSYPLPAVQLSGTSLQIKNDLDSDSLGISISFSPGVYGSYMLIGQSRQTICYAATAQIGKETIQKNIPKNYFATGITRFTLLNADGIPLNERLVFIDHHDYLKIETAASKKNYSPGDSVSLALKVLDVAGTAATGSFSLAVTDDSQVEPDKDRENILSAMMLNNAVQGHIEDPGYYFNTTDQKAWASLDLLLLTQGWTAYNWKQALDPNYQPVFKAEKEFTIGGRISNVFNKGVNGGHVLLLSTKPLVMLDTVADAKGHFYFTNLPVDNGIAYHIQARNRNNNSYNIGIELDGFKAPDIVTDKNTALPWYVNTDSTINTYTRNNARKQAQKDYPLQGKNLLKEVRIKAKKIIKDSHNLNGAGNSDLAIDEQELVKAGKKTMYDLLTERLPGFHLGGRTGNWYFYHFKPIIIIIDGLALHEAYAPFTVNDYTNWLRSTSAEDVKGIEVIVENSITYDHQFFGPFAVGGRGFIEITTRGGKGPFNSSTPGTYLYKPMPVITADAFYRPKYNPANLSELITDLRSTIHWEPRIVPDANGNAAVSFFTAGKSGTYTYTIEGADFNGNIGYATGKIVVK